MDEVTEKLNKIIMDRFNINIQNFSQKIEIGISGLGLLPRDMIYLKFDIERQFGIRISEDDIMLGNFKKLNDIIKLISLKIH